MIDSELLAILRCPVDGTQLELATSDLVTRVNEAIARGEIRDHADQTVTEPIDGGLVPLRGDLLYPIRDQIPSLIVDEAIVLTNDQD